MRTLILIASGLALWGAMLGLAKSFGTTPSAMRTTTIAFVILWGVIAAVNMYIGVARAGYSVREELPIFFAIWLAPAIPALLVRWRFL
jgi:phage shock protein PspC (stress-responsive transcriptional regulator)